MSLFRPSKDETNAINNAIAVQQQAYQNAQNLLSPYTQNAGTDFQNERNFIYDSAGKIAAYGNPAQNMWQSISESPADLYAQDISSFQLSPGAQFQLQQEEIAARNEAAASGALGSTGDIAKQMKIAQGLVAQDQQQYFDDLQKERQNQMNALRDYRNVTRNLLNTFNNMINREFSASTSLAGTGEKIGQSISNLDVQRGRAQEQGAQNILSRAGNLLGLGIAAAESL